MKSFAEAYGANRVSTAPLGVACEKVQCSASAVLRELHSAVLSYDSIVYNVADSNTILRVSRSPGLPLTRGVPRKIQKLEIGLQETALLIEQELAEDRCVLFSGTLQQTKELYTNLAQTHAAMDNLLLCGVVRQSACSYRLSHNAIGSHHWRVSCSHFWPPDFIITGSGENASVVALRTPKSRQLFDTVSDGFAVEQPVVLES